MRKPVPVNRVRIHIEVLAEAVVAVLIFGMCAMLLIIASTPVPV